MRDLILFIIFSLFFSVVYASEEKPLEPEQSIVSQRHMVSFYQYQSAKEYAAFTISSLDDVAEIPMTAHENGGYYYCYPPQIPASCFCELEWELDQLKKYSVLNEPLLNKVQILAPEIDLETLARVLVQSDVVIISFGAGLSFPFVPTLEEFCQSFNLQKLPSTDCITDESMKGFMKTLVERPKEILMGVEKTWRAVNDCVIESTPNHLFLKQLIELLGRTRKILTYTDNIDGIHDKCGIALSRTEDTLDPSGTYLSQNVIYPEQKDLEGKKVVCLPIGQSFDFDGVLSTTYTLAERYAASFQFVLMNAKQTPLFVYKDLVVTTGNTREFFTCNKSILPHTLAKGDLQETLPTLYRLVAQHSDALPACGEVM